MALAALWLAGSAVVAAPSWHDGLEWQGRHAAVTTAKGRYVLRGPFGRRDIPEGASSVGTASPLFDALFAMAQDDLKRDSVTAIRDGAFDHGRPIPCHCFETGEKWPYVWTRDLSYSVDLGLWRFDPARSRNGLLFKLSGVRAKDVPQDLYPMQDTGSGGSWPISTDRVVWFLGARHLLDDPAFADKVWQALHDTLAQDREYAFDARLGLYRGETSFLDWREQTYPEWTKDNVVFIGQSFALSTNVLHYEALRLAARMAAQRGDARAKRYAAQAEALKAAINAHFWRADRGMYMSYIGGDGLPVEAYDLLGISLAITSGVADADRARSSLAHYPAWPAGSPVIWPERADQPIYHNRAIWPFVSAYALRAARKVDDPALIAFEIESIMRGAALAGSNMENYALLTQSTHVDDGKLSGPVVDSPRQLWSVAGYLDMVTEGVFGLTGEGKIDPKLPASLVPMLFGKRQAITLQLPDRTITLKRPQQVHGNLLVTDKVEHDGQNSIVTLKAVEVPAPPLRMDAPMYAPATPAAPRASHGAREWRVDAEGDRNVLYVDGRRFGQPAGTWALPESSAYRCLRVTRLGQNGVESLPGPATCVGGESRVSGPWPRTWTAPVNGSFRLALDYSNDHGPINTGVTAAVKRLVIACAGSKEQIVPVVMPHSIGEQRSSSATFDAKAGARCTFALQQGFNMSDLANFAHYTGGTGGSEGPLNDAKIGALHVARSP
ncbi:MAG TPA: Six-hairpin glycosidase-like protein [Rhodanobacteraceae bacterium]|nr:Six-hairpin glycosidase-like protein [Rhodanobacteraceae bacterium]